ncbi:MAG: regulatory protein RecX [Candidatus Acidiferrales bacterium]
MRQKLQRRALNPAEVEPLLAHLAGRGWLDDRTFALAYARARAENRRLGRYRIQRELRRRGLAEELISAALLEVLPAEKDERRLARQRIERRLRGQKPPYSEKLLRSLYASLLRAGFPSAIIRDELFRRGARQLAEEPEPEEDDQG